MPPRVSLLCGRERDIQRGRERRYQSGCVVCVTGNNVYANTRGYITHTHSDKYVEWIPAVSVWGSSSRNPFVPSPACVCACEAVSRSDRQRQTDRDRQTDRHTQRVRASESESESERERGREGGREDTFSLSLSQTDTQTPSNLPSGLGPDLVPEEAACARAHVRNTNH